MLWYRERLVWKVTRWGWNLYVPTFLLICQIEWSAVWIHKSVLLQQGDIGLSGARVISCLHTYFLFISYYILHCAYSQDLHTVVNFLSSLTSKHSGCERSIWQEWNWWTKGESSYEKVKIYHDSCMLSMLIWYPLWNLQGKIGRIGAPGCKGDPGDKVSPYTIWLLLF